MVGGRPAKPVVRKGRVGSNPTPRVFAWFWCFGLDFCFVGVCVYESGFVFSFAAIFLYDGVCACSWVLSVFR